MKRNLFYLLMLVCSMSVFTACGDDDDDVKFPIDEEIAGTYKGTLDVKLDGNDIGSGIPNNISITKAGDNKITMGLKNFEFANMSLNIDIQNCEVKKSGDEYTFDSSQTISLQAPIGDCPTVVNGVVSGDKITINLDITVPALGGQKVKVAYKGSRLTGSESSEAKILSFALDTEGFTESVIDNEAGTIVFRMMDTSEDENIKAVIPSIAISDKATIYPSADVAQNFSNNNVVEYTVVAENGTIKKYSVSTPSFKLKEGFEVWMRGVGGADESFYEPAGWSSSNTGAHLLKAFGLTDKYVISPTEDAHSGAYAARIETLDTQGRDMGFVKVPKVTTGSLFLGKFITDAANTLNSTKFGIQYDKRPQALKGYYKYTPGPTFYTCKSIETCHVTVPDPDKTDKCSIKAVLYTTPAYAADWSDCLTGVSGDNNIYTSDRVVAIASMEAGEQSSWKEFNISFEYKKNFDATKKHRMTIVFSSSNQGDKFWGAPGSVLSVDDVELVLQ